MNNPLLFIAALAGFSGVAMGAFGAHGLRASLSAEMMAVYQTGVDYQMWHALGLAILAGLQRQDPESALLRWAGWLMAAGILLFSGSLYVLSVTGSKWLGMVTPFGGTAFLAAWLALGFYALRKVES